MLAVGGDVLGVGGQDGLLDDRDEFVEGDRLLLLDPPQQTQIDVHDGLPIQLSPGTCAPPASSYGTGCCAEPPGRAGYHMGGDDGDPHPAQSVAGALLPSNRPAVQRISIGRNRDLGVIGWTCE